jgi:hypothetical protein
LGLANVHSAAPAAGAEGDRNILGVRQLAGWEYALPMTNSIYDMDETPLTGEELAAMRQNARSVVQLWKRRAVYSTIAFFLSCASVAPFSKGQVLHAHAEPFGRILVYLSMGLFVVLVICIGVAISSWMHVRELEKTDA